MIIKEKFVGHGKTTSHLPFPGFVKILTRMAIAWYLKISKVLLPNFAIRMSMDKILEADSKPYVSSVVSIEDFRDRAAAAEAKVLAYFQVPAAFRLQELQDLEDEASTSAEPVTVEAIESDCRLSFKYFLNSKGFAMSDGDDVVNYME